MIVIQEVFGLTDWLRGVADQLAKDGFIAVAPDLVSGYGPSGGGTDSVASRDDVVALVRKLSPEEADKRLDAVRDWALKLPAGNGRVGDGRLLLGRRPQLRLRRARSRTSTPPSSTTARRREAAGDRRDPRRRCSATTAATTRASTPRSSPPRRR